MQMLDKLEKYKQSISTERTNLISLHYESVKIRAQLKLD